MGKENNNEEDGSVDANQSKNEYSEVTVDDNEDEDVGLDDDNDSKSSGDDEEMSVSKKLQLRKSHTFFHIILALAACYYAMLFTNWAKSDSIDTKGVETLWINMGSQWCCIALFWWTLIAPVICPQRFAPEDDYDEYL